ncbi:type 1 glutamine amidotransferase domain-containing protein [Kozakia baliensis]|uniref:Uncharacterized protein n=1 Tax=Kozakia baliensis TaxID=153496 RepID=A0A1D8UUS3_9PROT|nr:type 1 glutamine amidotransferase domain-containing protein [Kozakia baliensis]AOX17400.1 hypothetical protein A0U89_09915 [Kozakia baliensis]GBR30352.1 protease I [Kozakia baliensis NRIC 0488]GEL63149.1 protease [Kozakia baliensis]
MAKVVAILATNGVEEVEMVQPREALEKAGIQVKLVSPQGGEIQAMNEDVKPAKKYKVDLTVGQAADEKFDGLVLPGGTTNPDHLRMDEASVAFVRGFVNEKKPIAAICHGAWTLIEANGVKGKTLTSWPSVHTDLVNAGAKWVDQEVVEDGNLVTSRNPHDLPAFCKALVAQYAS